MVAVNQQARYLLQVKGQFVRKLVSEKRERHTHIVQWTDRCKRPLKGLVITSKSAASRGPSAPAEFLALDLDRCHTCDFIARFCRSTLSSD